MADQVLSVIVPVKDEAATVADVLLAIEEADVPGMEKQIIVVDDGSTDGTSQILDGYQDRTGYTIVHHPTNYGKGRAIRTAVEHMTGSIAVVQDADREYDPSAYASLVEPILAGRTRVVYGSRFLGTAQGMALPNLIANKVVTWIADHVGPAHITDQATCFKVFDTDVLRAIPLRSTGFEFCHEVTGFLQAIGEPILEVPIRYTGRSKQEGKKVRPKDGVLAVSWLLWSRFGRRGDRGELVACLPR